jgi:hypothetical protein
VFDHHGARQWNVTFYWRLKIGSEMPDVAPDILSGSNYDIKEFNKAQARVIDETQRNLIPAIRKQLKLPKELTDLVEKK